MTLVPFFNVKLDADTARDLKRATIHLADRGIRLRPVDDNAGDRTLARIIDMKRHPGKYHISEEAASHMVLDSDHRGGFALDIALTIADRDLYMDTVPYAWRVRILRNWSVIYDYFEHVAAAYNLHLDRPNYPAIPGERNHVILDVVGNDRVKPLSRAALKRWTRAKKL